MTLKRKNKTSHLTKFKTAILVLENKSVYKGIGLGYVGEATGEVCFNTSLTGYQEIISDPSYAGQIINFTFPHIGNVGTNNEDLESDKIWTRGVIFNAEITSPSNYRSLKNLDEWLKKNKIVGITGLDTRCLTNFIRDKGAPKGTISNNKSGNFNIKKLINISTKWPGLNGLDLAQDVTTKKTYTWKGLKTWEKGKGFKKNKKKERIKNIDVELENWGNLKTNSEKMISELNNRKNKINLEISENKKNPEWVEDHEGAEAFVKEKIMKENVVPGKYYPPSQDTINEYRKSIGKGPANH